MTQITDDLPEILSDAQKAGEIAPPKQLLKALSQETSVLILLSNPMRSEPFFAEFSKEFGFFPIRHINEAPLAIDLRRIWSALFRWLYTELACWKIADDPHMRKLGAIFIVAQSVRSNQRIWASMPLGIYENLQLLECLTSILRNTVIDFGVRGATESIWERDAVERFKTADAAGDWAEVGQSMRLFEDQLSRIGAAFSQSVRLLFQCGQDHLVSASSSIRQSLVAMQLAKVLPRPAGVALAAASENQYVQFACVYQAVSRHGNSSPLSSDEQDNLLMTLNKVADDPDRWIAWMKIFNTYPIRYPALQTALGKALATASDKALQAYVDVVSLHPWPAEGGHNDGRRIVADCLRSFRAEAPLERRRLLWRLAYERWNGWSFGQEAPKQHLFEINRSDIDFALVAFVSECLDQTQRAQELDRIRQALQDLDSTWFASITDLLTSWNRLLSRFQPFAHAVQSSSDAADWLCETQIYLPFDPAINTYIQAKFNM